MSRNRKIETFILNSIKIVMQLDMFKFCSKYYIVRYTVILICHIIRYHIFDLVQNYIHFIRQKNIYFEDYEAKSIYLTNRTPTNKENVFIYYQMYITNKFTSY